MLEMSEADRRMKEVRPWTAEDIVCLEDLYFKGLTHRQIAQRLGRTRNAVCGRIWRDRLPERSPRQERVIVPEPEPSKLERMAAMEREMKPAGQSQCVTLGCRGPRQPGRQYCAACITAAIKEDRYRPKGRKRAD